MATNSPPTEPDLELLGYYRAEFNRARIQHVIIGRLQFGAAALSGLAVFLPSTTYVTTAAALLCGAACVFFTSKASQSKGAADRGRRALLLIKGLDLKISGKERSDILSCFTATEAEAHALADPNYYDNTDLPGPGKLACMVQESAHYSAHLYKNNAVRTWCQVAASVLLSIAILLSIPLLPDQKMLLLMAQMVCLGLSVLITRDLIGKALSHQEAAVTTAEVDQRLERLAAAEITEANVLFIVEDYNAAVQAAPLPDPSVYDKHKERLAQLWKIRVSTPKQ